jgi:two-component system response regulator RegA
MSETTRTLLLVDDDERLRARLARALTERGFEVRSAGDVDSALQLAQQESPEYALVDLKMPGKSGLELVKALKELDPTTRVVVLTGYGSIATALEAVRLGAVHYLTKPADTDEIVAGLTRGEDEPFFKEDDNFSVPSLARAEWEHIHRILSECKGNISQAARLLGLHRRSLQRKLIKNPLDLEDLRKR